MRSNKACLLLILPLSSMLFLVMYIPPVRASSGLTIDGTGTACASSSINASILQGKGCGPSDTGSPLCATHSGGFCPLGELVILQILLNNTGSVTRVVGNQGLDQWYRRASVLSGQGGRMEEWYSVSTQAISNPAIYVTETRSGITIAAQEFAVSGYDADAPFDPSAGVPSNATGVANTISALVNTSHPNDLLLGLEYGGGGSFTAGPGLTGVCLYVIPCQFTGIAPDASEFATVPDVQPNFNVSIAQTKGTNWGLIVDAIKASSPAVLSISPSVGVVGSEVTITGISLANTVRVEFCGTSQSNFTIVNDSVISTYAPQLLNPPTTQTCDIVVTTQEGSSAIISADRFSFLPSIVSISPTRGGVGTAVTIIGTSFTSAMSVSICGVSQPRITVTNDTQIRTTVPETGLQSSTKCAVSITNPNGVGSARDMFNFLPQTRTPTTSAPLLSGQTPVIIGLTVVAVALLFGSQLIKKREPEEFHHAKSF